MLATVTASCSPGGAHEEGKALVVAEFYPLAEAAERVTDGDLAVVRNLTPPGVEPHDLELTPDQIAEVEEADVVLYLGHGFAPAIEDVVAQARGDTIDLLEGLHLRSGTGGGVDPHVWLDPVLYRRIVDRIARALPAASGGRFDTQLARLDRSYREGLRDCDRRVIVTAHAAFGYLAARYGLTQVPIAGIAPDAEPSPARLAELAELVRRDGVTTIFTEELASPRVAETLAREAGVRTAVLNPLEGLTADEVAAGEDYVSVMMENLRTLREALGCR